MSDIQRDSAGSAGSRRQKQIHRYALACDLIAGMKVLEIGLGDGTGAALLAGRAGVLEGVDIDARNVAVASDRRLPRTRFQVASPQTLPFEDGRFDAVIGFNIDWSGDVASALTEIRRVLTPDGFAMLRTAAGQAEAVGVEIRRVFKRRFALAQRVIAASYIGPASATALPNAADYRGYTLAPDGVVPGVVRPAEPEDIIWIVGQTALPRAEAADSLFRDPDEDLQLDMDPPATPAGPTVTAPVATGDMAVIAALVEQMAEGPVGGDAASLARAIGQANVRLAVQDLKLADRERLNAGLAAAEQEYRRLADQLRDSREQTAAVRLLAAEQRALADQLAERLTAATREADARRQVIDETLDQTQNLAVSLEQARSDLDRARAEAEATRSLAQDMEAALAQARSEIDAARSRAEGLEADAVQAREELATLRETFTTEAQRAHSFVAEADVLRQMVQTADAAAHDKAAELEALTQVVQRLEQERDAVQKILAEQLERERQEATGRGLPRPGGSRFPERKGSGRRGGQGDPVARDRARSRRRRNHPRRPGRRDRPSENAVGGAAADPGRRDRSASGGGGGRSAPQGGDGRAGPGSGGRRIRDRPAGSDPARRGGRGSGLSLRPGGGRDGPRRAQGPDGPTGRRSRLHRCNSGGLAPVRFR
ncbi:methyltransferase domain-containing protein [Brevundimonas sp. VNH65]|uniref:methyltransferase domain-containing protein n=1 Tax=Brevundimonas sp. VNH65 TaxID=3400917 RepID=UPI003C10C8CE